MLRSDALLYMCEKYVIKLREEYAHACFNQPTVPKFLIGRGKLEKPKRVCRVCVPRDDLRAAVAERVAVGLHEHWPDPLLDVPHEQLERVEGRWLRCSLRRLWRSGAGHALACRRQKHGARIAGQRWELAGEEKSAAEDAATKSVVCVCELSTQSISRSKYFGIQKGTPT